MRKTPLRKVSSKQAILDKEWRETTLLKWAEQGRKCSWCSRHITYPVGHHIKRRSRGRNDSLENCYVCHYVCHSEIHDNNVDVSFYKTRQEWLDRNKTT